MISSFSLAAATHPGTLREKNLKVLTLQRNEYDERERFVAYQFICYFTKETALTASWSGFLLPQFSLLIMADSKEEKNADEMPSAKANFK